MATKATSAEVMGAGKVAGVVMWAHWAVQVALGGTQTVAVALGLLVLTDTGQAKLTCNPAELPLACSWSSGSSADTYHSWSESEFVNTGESEA